MKHSIYQFSILAILLQLGGGCSRTKPPSTTMDVSYIHPELSIGEYLQIDDQKRILTFVRDPLENSRGLVRINPTNSSMEVLDIDATDGRDLLISNKWIVYRRGAQAFLLSDQRRILFAEGVEKIRTIIDIDDTLKVFVDLTDHRSLVLTMNANGEVLRQIPSTHSARAAFWYENQIQILSQNKEGLYLSKLDLDSDQWIEPVMIDAGDVGSYTAAKYFKGKLWIAYLDSDKGTLKLATGLPGQSKFEITLVDGDADKTMRGMDICFFEDGENLGMIYLDAWALRLRMARFQNGKWVTEQLPVRGSVGFYPHILDSTPESLTIVFHNYRSEHESLKPTFEDLAKGVIRLL